MSAVPAHTSVPDVSVYPHVPALQYTSLALQLPPPLLVPVSVQLSDPPLHPPLFVFEHVSAVLPSAVLQYPYVTLGLAAVPPHVSEYDDVLSASVPGLPLHAQLCALQLPPPPLVPVSEHESVPPVLLDVHVSAVLPSAAYA